MSNNPLIPSIKYLVKTNKRGSFQTQNKRLIELTQMAHDLKEQGYSLNHPSGLKPKHVEILTNLWKGRGYAAGTMKNKATQLRWWAKTVGKAGIVPTNDNLGFERRRYITNENKAIELPANLKAMNPLMQVYLKLQRHLGLRREEAMKLKPYQADRGTYLELQGSWTKGGRPRYVLINTDEARATIEEAKQFAKNKQASLIPENRSYVRQLYFYKHQLEKFDIHHAHGLRHNYAQDKYKILTGWECPVRGGLSYKEMTEEQKRIDNDARLQISELLGHSRLSITYQYLGK